METKRFIETETEGERKNIHVVTSLIHPLALAVSHAVQLTNSVVLCSNKTNYAQLNALQWNIGAQNENYSLASNSTVFAVDFDTIFVTARNANMLLHEHREQFGWVKRFNEYGG